MTNLKANTDSLRLRAHLENLPQELYDQIYLEVFTAPPGARYPGGTEGPCPEGFSLMAEAAVNNAIDRKLLRISSASRALYAKSCYGEHTRFYINMTITYKKHWLHSLCKEHRALFPKVVELAHTGRRFCPETISQWRETYTTRGFEAGNAANVFVQSRGRIYGDETGKLDSDDVGIGG